jgi:hypothetical protein
LAMLVLEKAGLVFFLSPSLPLVLSYV